MPTTTTKTMAHVRQSFGSFKTPSTAGGDEVLRQGEIKPERDPRPITSEMATEMDSRKKCKKKDFTYVKNMYLNCQKLLEHIPVREVFESEMNSMGSLQKTLTVGDLAPDFAYRDAGGVERRTHDLKGRVYVVYFYPKDDTPGCTKEACSFRDGYGQFAARGVEVIGVSPDSEKSHAKFREKFELPFAMAADPEKTIVEAYGVWGEKKFMGRTYMGAHRVTFVIGADGRIARVFDKVKPEGHAVEVLGALEEL